MTPDGTRRPGRFELDPLETSMNATARRYQSIPTNLVTGFLGVGKTTTIRSLLEQRPAGEHWAVLVNEFGEVGVDGTLLQEDGVGVTQVPGGCLCCASAQMFTVGLNRLIRQENPDRILIEPTGLGHPAEILRTLTHDPFAEVLDLRATLTVLDARHLSSPRHRQHPNWIQQIQQADLLLANKSDQYSEADEQALLDELQEYPPPRPHLVITREGRLDPAELDRPRRAPAPADGHAHKHEHEGHDHGAGTPQAMENPGDPDEWMVVDGRGEGHRSRSWLFPTAICFEHQALNELLAQVSSGRIKGIVRTDRGWQRLNRVDGSGKLEPMNGLDQEPRARLELIQPEPQGADPESLDARLRALAREARC